MMIKSVSVSASGHGNPHPMDRLTRSFMEARDDLLRFLKRRGRQRAAEDIVQTVWLKLRERDEDPQTWQEPRAVLFTTAATLGTDSYRRETVAERAILREAASAEATSHGPDPEAYA